MKTKIILLSILLFLGAVVAEKTLAADAKTKPKPDSSAQWEHLALMHEIGARFPDADLSKRIIQLGGDGWELVSVENFSESGTTVKTGFFFKRPL